MEKYIHGTHSAMRNKDKGVKKAEAKKPEGQKKEKAAKPDKPCDSCRGL